MFCLISFYSILSSRGIQQLPLTQIYDKFSRKLSQLCPDQAFYWIYSSSAGRRHSLPRDRAQRYNQGN